MKKINVTLKQSIMIEITFIACYLLISCGALIPIVVKNLGQAHMIASKLNAKTAWEETYNEDNSALTNYYWNDGTYYWIVDIDGNVQLDSNK